MSRHPEVKWAEREDKVYLTVLLPDAKDPKVNLDPEGVFSFAATAGTDNNTYELKLNLFDKVDVEESKINIGMRNVFCVLEKVEKKWWTKLLRGGEKTPHYVKVDWDKWVDEDDDGPAEPDLGGMDFSKFGDMGGMGGMGGLGGMGGMGGLGGMGGMGGLEGLGGMGGLEGLGGMGGLGGMMGGMGGMPGMGGMGGMQGMGGMGGLEHDDDSDEEELEIKKPEGATAKGESEASATKTKSAQAN